MFDQLKKKPKERTKRATKTVKKVASIIMVLHNGVLIQDHFKLQGSAEYIGWSMNKCKDATPMILEDHGDKTV